MNFHFILSNTTRVAPLSPMEMPAMTAQADLDKLSTPVHVHALIMRFNRE